MQNQNSVKYTESIDTFKVSFGCCDDKHSVDAELFISTIDNTISLVKSAANVLYPDAFVRLEIKANKAGSFETVIDTITKHSITLFTPESLQCASAITQGFVNFLIIKTHLKGKKAKRIEEEENNYIIENQDSEIINIESPQIVNAYFEDAKIENSIINVFTGLEAKQVPEYSIEHGEKKISFKKEEFGIMKESIVENTEIITSRLETQEPIKVNLLLKKPDLLGDSAWQFVYDKNIDAKIEDKDFLAQVHKGYIKLYAGVKIPCMLQIEYELDDKYNIINNSQKYRVLEVVGDIIEPPKQDQFDL